jgi:parvulin-like peptidyl-prolyl isomerase
LRGLVAELLKEELLSREAREMKLHENDTVVRRRLAQKLQFLVQDVSRLPEPTDEELRRFYGSHSEWFQTGPRVSFKHIFFSRQRRSNATADAENALLHLSEGGASTPEVGDRLMLDAEVHDADAKTVAALFGPGFAKALLAVAPGAWNGPVESGYGVHLVYLSELKPAVQPDLAAVRAQVLARWREEASRKDYERYLAGIREKYVIVVDESVGSLVGPPRGRTGAATGGTAD